LAHPERFDQDHLDRVEGVLKQGQVRALKVYLGYLRYEPYAPAYRRYYKLAAKYKIPVIFHCGDTYSVTAKVRYAHPLKIDEVAVDFPETKFVLAHFGNPWIMDAAQVAYKNKNVWIDLSAIVIGDAEAFAGMQKEGVLDRAVERIKDGPGGGREVQGTGYAWCRPPAVGVPPGSCGRGAPSGAVWPAPGTRSGRPAAGGSPGASRCRPSYARAV
jgi:hypothetical protein